MRIDIYIKKYAQQLVAQLNESWSSETAMELLTTLEDYKKVRAQAVIASNEAKPVKDDKIRLRDCEGNKIYKRFFDFFLKESTAGKSPIVVYPNDVQLSYEDLVKWSNRINLSNYKNLHHKNCVISKYTKSDCVEFTLTRKEN